MAVLTRRAAIGGLTLAGLAAGWAVPVVAAAGQGPLTWSPKALSVSEAEVLALACETIIPTTDTPGAIAAGVPQFIDRTLADWCEPAEATSLRNVLARIDADARKRHGKGFGALTPGQRTEVLTAIDAGMAGQPGQPFARLKELATAGYFTSEIGATKTLRYDPIPGAYRGCVPLSEIGRAWAT